MFLCTTIDPGIAYYVVVLFLIFIYPFFFEMRIVEAKDLFTKGDIREIIYKNLVGEWKWFLGILGYLSFVVPACTIFFPFAFILLAFPVYFTFNFIFYFLNRQKYNEKERKLLMRFYGIPTFIILIGGIIFKIIFYKLKYGNYFLSEMYYYYINDQGGYLFIIILAFLFVIFIAMLIDSYLKESKIMTEK
jgi:hypothetical protein